VTLSQLTQIEDVPPDLIREPLNWLFAEHHRHRQLCRLLEELAGAMVFDAERVSMARTFIARDLPLHVIDEEQDFFPLLCRRCEVEDEIEPVLDRLAREHAADSEKAARVEAQLEQSIRLRRAPGQDPASKRAFAEFAAQQRRHLGLENAVVLPLARRRLRPHDLIALSVRLAARRGQVLDEV